MDWRGSAGPDPRQPGPAHGRWPVTSSLPLPLTSERSSPSRSSRLDSFLLCGVFGLLLFGPLGFGAVEVWSISILQVGAGLLFALWAARQVALGELEIMGNPLFLPSML